MPTAGATMAQEATPRRAHAMVILIMMRVEVRGDER